MKNYAADISEFKERLEKSWSRETSEHPGEWNENNPALGQCLISALVFQDYFGGDIMQGKIAGTYPYYWNKLPNGAHVHLTIDQLPAGITVPEGKARKGAAIERILKASRPDVLEKYKILKRRVEA